MEGDSGETIVGVAGWFGGVGEKEGRVGSCGGWGGGRGFEVLGVKSAGEDVEHVGPLETAGILKVIELRGVFRGGWSGREENVGYGTRGNVDGGPRKRLSSHQVSQTTHRKKDANPARAENHHWQPEEDRKEEQNSPH